MKFLTTVLLATVASTMASKCCWPVEPRNHIKLNGACNDMLDMDAVETELATAVEAEMEGDLGDLEGEIEPDDRRQLKEKNGGIVSIEFTDHYVEHDEETSRHLRARRDLLQFTDEDGFMEDMGKKECNVPSWDVNKGVTANPNWLSPCTGCVAAKCISAKDICEVLIEKGVIEKEIKLTIWRDEYYYSEKYILKLRGLGYLVAKVGTKVYVTVKAKVKFQLTAEPTEDEEDCIVSVDWWATIKIIKEKFYRKKVYWNRSLIFKKDGSSRSTYKFWLDGWFDFSVKEILPKICPKLWGEYCKERENTGEMDPHFRTWNNEWFDYHGECDLVYLRAPDFHNGLGMETQIRTTTRYDYSYIEEVAIKIGDDVFQVGSWGEYSLNGVDGAAMPAVVAGEYAVTHEQLNKKQHVFNITLVGEEHITIKTFKDFVGVEYHKAVNQEFGTSVGLMGNYFTGDKLGRDNTTAFNDINAFGQEWQVLDTEENLFSTIRAPQFPAKCNYPTKSKNGFVGGGAVSKEVAEDACGFLSGDAKARCVSDVMISGDLDAATAVVY